MKKIAVLLLCTLSAFVAAAPAIAQNASFPGVEKAMSPQAYEAAGLNKLSPEERARLDEFIRGYAAASSEKAASAAVDEATREGKVKRNGPEVIQSSIVGRFTGYTGRTTFTLENGQVFKQSQQVSRVFPAVDSPPVLVIKGTSTFAGYRMYIAGGGNIRVSRVR
ncbi:MAG: hypothetical protein H0X53_04650 [Sphingomonas sp.]|nr:hypothetical protein [Sphingomonas sp.]